MAASIYLGLEFAFVNDSLQQKLKEVNELSEKNLAQEREKQEILSISKRDIGKPGARAYLRIKPIDSKN